MKQQNISLLLVLAMLVCMLSSCSDSKNHNPSEAPSSESNTSETTMDSESDTSEYADMSIADIRNSAEDTMVQVDGVVSAITYSFGMVPSGVILVDDTQSIYVYDANLAAQVSVGNAITVQGSKTHWILEDEAENAAKFGYQGCCQLENVTLVSINGKATNYNKSWIKTSTIKDILENPMENDITSTIFKVNALVKKVEGKGFVNYYFFDIDGKTGSYTYTQCSGSDFAWLDEYDGKICTVYLTALNAKATASECFYRLLPIEVIDEGYRFPRQDTAKHIVEYYGVDQFEASYSGNPELELITSVSSELLGFENAQLSYTSDNKDVIDFVTSGDKVIMNCLSTGTANILVSGRCSDIVYNETITISVEMKASDSYQYISVADAMKANVGDEISVKGIVGPSLVNKDGFYLIDDTGVIAVLMDTAVLDTLEIGHEVILKGSRDRFHDASKSDSYGQTCITNCTVVVNNYGNHEYSTVTFDDTKTLADFYNLDATVDYSTTVYILKATVKLVETNYYTNIELVSGNTKVTLYCSSANQYNWLKAYAGQEVTMEIAPCNWNNKNYYRGCVLAVYTEDGKVLNELNFRE